MEPVEHTQLLVVYRSEMMMSKALTTWQNMANKRKDKDFETDIKKRWPHIQEEDWQQFIATHSDDEVKKKCDCGKDMWMKNTMNHKLRSRGYIGKRMLRKEHEKLVCS